MRLDAWLPMYHEICREFGYDEGSDSKGAELLSSLLSSRVVPPKASLEAECPEAVTVCGDGPSLPETLSARPPEGYIVAADRATTSLLDAGIVPDAVVTDLDGRVEDQLEANSRGALVFVHAHGDNMPAMREYVPRFSGRVVGTCQCPPVGTLLNLGGFTDGDRAACIFSGLGARRVVLVGFDFERPSPKASRSPDVKARKLRWARRILEGLVQEGVEIDGL